MLRGAQEEKRFRAGETVYDFAEGRKYLGLIARGSAVIQRIDHQGPHHSGAPGKRRRVRGDADVRERGRITCVIAEAVPRWVHAGRAHDPPLQACAHHSRLVENMFHIMTEKAAALSERVEVLSRRSIRRSCCAILACWPDSGKPSFQLPSPQRLAGYISRRPQPAMMRELKR